MGVLIRCFCCSNIIKSNNMKTICLSLHFTIYAINALLTIDYCVLLWWAEWSGPATKLKTIKDNRAKLEYYAYFFFLIDFKVFHIVYFKREKLF